MESITVSIQIDKPITLVWELWNNPEDIRSWNMISQDWHTPFARNELKVGGELHLVMGLKDGSFSFDFLATYDEVKTHELIAYTLSDGRHSTIRFQGLGPVTVSETFEPNENDPLEMQHDFCQAVLFSFKNYAKNQP